MVDTESVDEEIQGFLTSHSPKAYVLRFHSVWKFGITEYILT